MAFVSMSITATVALIRLVMLLAWCFYALFERRTNRRLWALVITLGLGNVVAIITAELLEVSGG